MGTDSDRGCTDAGGRVRFPADPRPLDVADWRIADRGRYPPVRRSHCVCYAVGWRGGTACALGGAMGLKHRGNQRYANRRRAAASLRRAAVGAAVSSVAVSVRPSAIFASINASIREQRSWS